MDLLGKPLGKPYRYYKSFRLGVGYVDVSLNSSLDVTSSPESRDESFEEDPVVNELAERLAQLQLDLVEQADKPGAAASSGSFQSSDDVSVAAHRSTIEKKHVECAWNESITHDHSYTVNECEVAFYCAEVNECGFLTGDSDDEGVMTDSVPRRLTLPWEYANRNVNESMSPIPVMSSLEYAPSPTSIATTPEIDKFTPRSSTPYGDANESESLTCESVSRSIPHRLTLPWER